LTVLKVWLVFQKDELVSLIFGVGLEIFNRVFLDVLHHILCSNNVKYWGIPP